MNITTKLVKPMITEKSIKLVKDLNIYTFVVEKSATAKNVASNVKKVFDVNVLDVRLLNMKGKTKSNAKTRRSYIKNRFKKAYVQVAKDQKIDLFDTGD